MPIILHTYRYTGRPWEILQSVVPAGYTIKTLDTPTYEQLVKEAENADYFLVSGRLPIDKGVLDAAKKLKMIQRTGVGTEMLDKEEIKQRGIPVYVNTGVNARSVAEHTLALMLSCLKRIPTIDKQVRQGIWKKQETGTSCHELYREKVGLVGMGAIGRQVAEYLHVFGAKIIYTDLYRLPLEQEERLEATYVPSFEDMLPQVDILSFHCPLTFENKEIFNEKALSMIKPGAIIINTARGKLIDEPAMAEALRENRIKAFCADVLSTEPPALDNPLLSAPRAFITPHIAWATREARGRIIDILVGNLKAFIAGAPTNVEN